MSEEQNQKQNPGEGGNQTENNQQSGLQLNPVEQELMGLKRKIMKNFEEIRHSVGSVQLEYIETVQNDLARAQELLHSVIVSECKNKVNVYKRQLNRLGQSLQTLLGDSETSLAKGIIQTAPDAVYAAEFLCDETLIASACGDGVVRISELVTGKLVRECVGHDRDSLFRIDVSPDGTRVISGGKDKTARIWDPYTGDCLMTLAGHTDTVLGTVFVDNNTAATCSQDCTLRIWDLRSGKCKFFLQPDGKPLLVCSAFPARKMLAVASNDGSIFYVDPRKGIVLRRIEAHKSAIWFMHYSPNGRMLCSCGEDSIVRVWDAETGSLLRALGEEGLCSNYCRFSSNSKMVAASNMDKTIRIWNVENGKVIRTLTGHTGWTFGCTFSADDRLLLTTSEDGTVRLWRLDTGEPVTPDMFEKRSISSRSSHEKPRISPKHREEDCSPSTSEPALASYDVIRVNLCPEHNNPLGFYCVEERKFLCDECVKVHDKEHHISDGLSLSNMAEHAVQDFMASFLQSISGADDILETHTALLAESRRAARNKVEATIDTVIQAIYARRKQLLDQVDDAFEQAAFSLQSQHDTYNRTAVAIMKTFASEFDTHTLCETYLNNDSRFTKPLSPLELQQLQLCYFGNTVAKSIAGDISRMGTVAIKSSPPTDFSAIEEHYSAQNRHRSTVASSVQSHHSDSSPLLKMSVSPLVKLNLLSNQEGSQGSHSSSSLPSPSSAKSPIREPHQ